MLRLNLHQFTDPDASGGHEPHHKVPKQFPVFLQRFFKILIISLTDNIFEESFLLHLNKLQLQISLSNAFQVTVDGPDPQIHRLGLVGFNQPHFVIPQAPFRHLVILVKKLSDGE